MNKNKIGFLLVCMMYGHTMMSMDRVLGSLPSYGSVSDDTDDAFPYVVHQNRYYKISYFKIEYDVIYNEINGLSSSFIGDRNSCLFHEYQQCEKEMKGDLEKSKFCGIYLSRNLSHETYAESINENTFFKVSCRTRNFLVEKFSSEYIGDENSIFFLKFKKYDREIIEKISNSKNMRMDCQRSCLGHSMICCAIACLAGGACCYIHPPCIW